MTTYLQDPSVQGPHPDGTYTIPDPVEWASTGGWTIRLCGNGWVALRDPRTTYHGVPFATAEDAAMAVLGDPAKACRVGGSR